MRFLLHNLVSSSFPVILGYSLISACLMVSASNITKYLKVSISPRVLILSWFGSHLSFFTFHYYYHNQYYCYFNPYEFFRTTDGFSLASEWRQVCSGLKWKNAMVAENWDYSYIHPCHHCLINQSAYPFFAHRSHNIHSPITFHADLFYTNTHTHTHTHIYIYTWCIQ